MKQAPEPPELIVVNSIGEEKDLNDSKNTRKTKLYNLYSIDQKLNAEDHKRQVDHPFPILSLAVWTFWAMSLLVLSTSSGAQK